MVRSNLRSQRIHSSPNGTRWLFCLLFALVLRTSNAVTCDSHTDRATCNVSVDGAVKCTWNEAGKACVNSDERIAEGMVGTTSIENDTMPDISPDLSAGNVQGMLDALSLNSTFCDLPPDETSRTGITCAAYMPMWWYNSTSGMCEEYVYGGCSKTDNLFDFEDVCKAAAAEYCQPVAGGPAPDTVVTTGADSPKASVEASLGPASGTTSGAVGLGAVASVGVLGLLTFPLIL